MITVVGVPSITPSQSLTMDLNALATRVSRLLRRNDLDVEIWQWLNFSLRDLCHKVNFPELRRLETIDPLTVGTYEITLTATDISRVDRVYYKDTTASSAWGRNLDPLPRHFYEGADIERLLNSGSTNTGDPLYYMVEGPNSSDQMKLILYPAPSKAARLEVHYYKLPADMTQGTDTPEISNRWRHYLVYLAYYWGMIFLEKEDPNKVILWERKYDSIINRVKSLVRKAEVKRELLIPSESGVEQGDRIY